MKIYHVFFYAACFIVLNNYSFSFAQTQIYTEHEITMLTENICNLLLHKHLDEDLIHFLLNKQCLKDKVINTIISQKIFEKFYKRKNSWTKIKNYYFLIKTIVILAIIIIVAYLLAHYLELPGMLCSKNLVASNCKQESNIGGSSHSDQPQTSNGELESLSEIHHPLENQKEQNFDIATQVQQEKQQPNQEISTMQLEQEITQQNMSYDFEQYPKINPFAPVSIEHMYDYDLNEKIKEQIKHAMSIGLEPEI